MSGSPFHRFMCWYDRVWREWHKVEKIDDLISLSFERYTGEAKLMNDDSWLQPGDQLAIMHFNRECFVSPGTSPRDYVRSALHFRKLIIASFTQLAQRFRTDDPRFREVKVLHGVSWLPPHGEKVGFMIERLPDNLLNRVRKFYFRLLLKTFFPVLAARENTRLQPHAYWLTRSNLLHHFSEELYPDEFRSHRQEDPESGEPGTPESESFSAVPGRVADYS